MATAISDNGGRAGAAWPCIAEPYRRRRGSVSAATLQALKKGGLDATLSKARTALQRGRAAGLVRAAGGRCTLDDELLADFLRGGLG